MTQLGQPVPPKLQKMRGQITSQLQKKTFEFIDADSIVTGKDFLDKIWKMIISVPVGVAIIHEDMSPKTIANVFYELGMMDALGKRTIVVKSPDAAMPSDFVRTEHIEVAHDFNREFQSFLDSVREQESYFEEFAENLEKNPLLSIDYLRRAYLISGNHRYRAKAENLLNAAGLQGRAKNSVEMLWGRF